MGRRELNKILATIKKEYGVSGKYTLTGYTTVHRTKKGMFLSFRCEALTVNGDELLIGYLPLNINEGDIRSDRPLSHFINSDCFSPIMDFDLSKSGDVETLIDVLKDRND